MNKSLLILPVIFLLVACGNKTVSATNETAVNSVPQTQAQVNNNIPAEYKQVTTNENGIKIYGKIVDINNDATLSERTKKAKNEILGYASNISSNAIVSEYYSEAYGGEVTIVCNDKNGAGMIFNEDGDKIITRDKNANKYDLENTLAKYRLGNAMAEAIDRKVSEK